MKNIFLNKVVLLLILVSTFSWGNNESSNVLVHNLSEFDKAVSTAEPGTVIVLAKGIWKDVEFIFKGNGTKEKPITLTVEAKGEVSIEGASNLKIGGQYLIVKDLYFKNGHTPSNTVIQFKIDNNTIANNCRVTNCVIESFTQPDRDVSDHWVELWGRNNKLDHNYITGKSNFGPTVRVYLKGNQHINNHHQITENHFGPRPRKGGPHGETLQIGDSYTSMTPSYANVANNFFDRCNGEIEIISSKSNFNQFSKNVFFECEGSLVLRHGNYAKIDGNIFIGNDNSEFIGGIRVINTGHWITNNYFYKLKGSSFRSPLAVMNGIPKSPLNRYNQVTDVVVAYNSYVDCKSPFQFSVGANVDQSEVLPPSEIRSARPVRTIVANNLIYNQTPDNFPIVAYDTVDGVNFKNNYSNSINKSETQTKGFITTDLVQKSSSEYLFIPNSNIDEVYNGFDFETIKTDMFGADRTVQNNVGSITVPVENGILLIDKKKYGTDWFSTENVKIKERKIQVKTNNELVAALENSISGDHIILASGTYDLTQQLPIDKTISITSKNSKKPAKLNFKNSKEAAAFRLLPKANLNISNVQINGTETINAFATLEKNMSKAYDLRIDKVEISNFKNVLEVSKGSFADTVSVINSKIKNCLNGIQLNKETNDKGDYNAEFLIIKNSTFENVQSNVVSYYRGGYDESTIGGNLWLEGNNFTDCGEQEESNILIETRGIVNVEFSNNVFEDNPVKYTAVLWGEKGQKPVENKLLNSGEIKIEENLKLKLMY
ncbi:chondroitinase-B domain-containing protein [Maribacter sp. Asnod1-A12]|uniref:chondroitinase-B domain-containing protein n=1 Tax=Maribacter sp. Asnod1-A12 TaxID=3160576 RepID=UPI003863978A